MNEETTVPETTEPTIENQAGATLYRIVHDAVGIHYQHSVVPASELGDIDWLLSRGAIEPVTDGAVAESHTPWGDRGTEYVPLPRRVEAESYRPLPAEPGGPIGGS